MSDSQDGYEATVRYWVNIPRITHKVMCLGKHIGDLWSDGNITRRDEETQSEPQVQLQTMVGPP